MIIVRVMLAVKRLTEKSKQNRIQQKRRIRQMDETLHYQGNVDILKFQMGTLFSEFNMFMQNCKRIWFIILTIQMLLVVFL